MIPEISREGPLCTHEHAELRTCRLRPPHRPYRLQPSRPPEFHRSGARQAHPCAPKGSKDRSDRPNRRSRRPALLGNHALTPHPAADHPAISAATTPPRPRRDGHALHRRRPRPGIGGEGGGPACPGTPSAHSHRRRNGRLREATPHRDHRPGPPPDRDATSHPFVRTGRDLAPAFPATSRLRAAPAAARRVRPRRGPGRTVLAGGHPAARRTRLGAPGDRLRPGAPGSGPEGPGGHDGPGGRHRTGLLRGPGGRPRSPCHRAVRQRHDPAAHHLRAGTGLGRCRRRSGGGPAGGRAGGRHPLPALVPPLGPAARQGVPGPAHPAPRLDAAARTFTPAARERRPGAFGGPSRGRGVRPEGVHAGGAPHARPREKAEPGSPNRRAHRRTALRSAKQARRP